ncbi:NAD(P)-binding protein [Xylariaceae sp. FL0594]|nr:NAD(P)-binding protein [Xylariaceae sp. FL0594]
MSLAGKRCIITGGSRGIGLAIAQLFASQGAACTLVGRHRETVQSAVESLTPTRAQEKIPIHQHDGAFFDVSTKDGWDDLLAQRKHETIDVLVNAAGVSHNSLLFKTEISDIDHVLDVNLRGTIIGCKSVIPKMIKQKSGCIINVSSLLAERGGRGASVYAAAKAGVVGLTRSLAWEVGRFGIRVNVILPGYIQTDMTKGMKREELATLIPLGRLGRVEEVAEAASFLATNAYAHNCVLNIDGGLSAT